MKFIKINHILSLLLISLLAISCQKDVEFNSLSTGNFGDTTGVLKTTSSFPIGFAIANPAFATDARYRAVVATQASQVTFENLMKHGSIVNDNGDLVFTNADQLADLASASQLPIHGHTLVWHSQQNGTYLRSLGGGAAPANPNLMLNGGFELGTGVDYTNWSKFNGSGSFSAGTGGEVRTGSRSMKAVVAADNPGGEWRVQLASDLINTTVGVSYRVSFYIKSASPGGTMRTSTQPTAQYQGTVNVGTDWSPVSWTFVARDAQTRILFDLGAKANSYFIDDVTVTDATAPPPVDMGQVKVKVDAAMKTYIQGMVNRYKTRGVKSWDVVNEVFADDGKLRTGASTGSTYHWHTILGDSYIANAFTYAAQADPTAELYINDYNLEQGNQVKVDSLVAFVKRLRTANVPVHGIGSQMHLTLSSSRAGIINSMKKLAGTGLKVKITELDIRVNLGNVPGYVPDDYALAYQAEMYKFVVDTYMKYVPAAQRGGITIWGVDDPKSWLTSTTRPDFALLFDKDYKKKPAFVGVLQGLKGQ